jgi:hypothetical protein
MTTVIQKLPGFFKQERRTAVDAGIITCILVCALALRLIFFTGMGPRDDIAYIGLARALQTGTFSLPGPDSVNVFAVRAMMYLPIFLSWKLFGISEPATSFYFILCSLVLVGAGYGMGRILFGRAEAVVTASLLCLLPLDTVFASQVMPDLPQAALGAAALLLFAAGLQRGHALLHAAAGGILGLALLTKEFSCVFLMIVPVIACCAGITYSRARLLQSLCIVYAACCGVLLLFWVPYLAHGDPRTPVQVLLNNALIEKNGNPDVWYYFKIMFNLYQQPWGTRYVGFFYYAAAAALPLLAAADARTSGPVIAWLLIYLVCIQWIGPVLTQRPTCERVERFLIPLGLPASLLIARLCGIVWRRSVIARPGVLLLLVVLSWSLAATTVRYAFPAEALHLWDLKRTARLMSVLATYPLYADYGSADKLRFLTGYAADIRGYPPDQRGFEHLSRCWLALDVCDEAFLKDWARKRTIPSQFLEVFRLRGPERGHFKNYDARIYWVP